MPTSATFPTEPAASLPQATSHWESARWLTLLGLWLAATAGFRPLLLPDEGRYANVAREMLGQGALVPLLNGLPFFHKPPLMYWLDMAAMALLGVHQFSARAAPLLGAWLMGASLFLAVRRWHGPAFARQALLVLASGPFFFIGGQYANLDMLVAGLITATVLALVRCLDTPQRPLRWLLLAWLLAALSVLAKGLIGVVLPALIVAPWLLAQRRWRELLSLLHPLGVLLFAAAALPWFVAMQLRYPGFFDYFIVEQHFRRFAQTAFNNVEPAWFYVVALPLLSLPWAVWLPAAVSAWRHQPSGTAPSPPRALRSLYLWWTAVVLVFFSLPSSKLVGYVLPALAPWCVLLALGAARHARGFRITLMVSALVCIGTVAALTWRTPKSSKPAAAALAAQMLPGERVVFVDHLFYDLPFYARLRQPVIVASDWADPKLPYRDNWRKELFDAARFDPVRGRELLWPLARLGELGCQPHAMWFVVKPADIWRLQEVPGAAVVYADADTQVLRAPGRRCP